MTILVIAPHPDDEAIGCGGAVCLHTSNGDRVVVAFMTSGEMGLKHLPRDEAWQIREAEAEAAAGLLGIARLEFLRQPDCTTDASLETTASLLAPLLGAEQPELVYVPHAGEWHPDHRAAFPALDRALRDSEIPAPRLLAYEVWTPLSEFDDLLDVTPVITRKLRAIRCYHSQLAQLRYDRAIRGLNQYRGNLAGYRYAEAFQHVSPADRDRQ